MPESTTLTIPASRGSQVILGRFMAFVELMKPELTGLSALTAVFGYVLAAKGQASWMGALSIGAATVLVGGGAGAWNQLIERRFDALMKRTDRRPIPSGRISPIEAGIFGFCVSVAGILILLSSFGPLPAGLAVLTLFLYVAVYTPLKRQTWLNTIVGAIPGALPTLIGWTAGEGTVSLNGWLLFFVLFLWQFPHFFSLAWMYRKDYERAGYRMLSVQDTHNALHTNRFNLLSCIGLLPVIGCFFMYESMGVEFTIAAVIATLGFTGIAGISFFHSMQANYPVVSTLSDARRLFFASLVYLPVIMGLGIVGRL